MRPISIAAGCLLYCLLPACLEAQSPWKMHVIDDSSKGADGVKLADINGDGRLDIVTGWEEGKRVKLYLQPAPSELRDPWPGVIVGEVASAEDAFFADVNADGQLDVVSCCEGGQQTVFAHIAPAGNENLLEAKKWQTIPFKQSLKKTRWMFGVAMELDGDPTTELICGSKNPNGQLGWFDVDPETPADSKWHQICDCGWIMSIFMHDVDGNETLDLVYSDRKGHHTGCWVRVNPGDGSTPEKWQEIPIGGQGKEVMFLNTFYHNETDLPYFICAVRPDLAQIYQPLPPLRSVKPKSSVVDQAPVQHQVRVTKNIFLPPKSGGSKCAVAADLDLDGKQDVVISCEHAEKKHGLYWLAGAAESVSNSDEIQPSFHTILGDKQGIKFDLIEVLDLDADGDLDLITCEERDQLGVIWLENPTK